jgi:hypothetical protein
MHQKFIESAVPVDPPDSQKLQGVNLRIVPMEAAMPKDGMVTWDEIEAVKVCWERSQKAVQRTRAAIQHSQKC